MEDQTTDHHSAGSAHWRTFASSWSLLGSPIRPCAEDVRLVEALLDSDPDNITATLRRALLFGVTPELAAARWPAGVELFAVERVAAMIAAVWPGHGPTRRAVCADWLRLPFSDGLFDLTAGDGCLQAVGRSDDQARFVRAAHRCLRRNGLLLLRLFCRPAVTESLEAIFAALRAGSIGSFHAFKWRLAMAMQGATQAPDVALADIWHVWDAARIDRQALAAASGWQLAEIGTIDIYRDAAAHFNFMTFDATLALLQDGGFDLIATRRGNYELAECCPHVLLRRRDMAPSRPDGTNVR